MSDDCKEILKFLHEHWPKINRAPDIYPYLERLKIEGQDAATADLRKPIETLLGELHAESYDDQSRDREMTVSKTISKFGSLLALLSVQADRQTRSIISLTRWLLLLTVALFILTGYLCVDAYSKNKTVEKDRESRAKP